MASAAGYIRAPPAPWIARKVTSQASAASPFGVSPHSADETAKITTPSTTMGRCPTMSANRPPNANRAAIASR
jgi:hypothetical protein